jgi:hypothetical protein
MTDKDPKKDSQLSRADKWLNNAIDPAAAAPEEKKQEPEESDQQEEKSDE